MLCCQIIHSCYWYHRTLIASWHEWMTGCMESSSTGMHQLNEEVSCWYITQSDAIRLALYIHISHINLHSHLAYRYPNVITPEYIVHGTIQFSYKYIFSRCKIYKITLGAFVIFYDIDIIFGFRKWLNLFGQILRITDNQTMLILPHVQSLNGCWRYNLFMSLIIKGLPDKCIKGKVATNSKRN